MKCVVVFPLLLAMAGCSSQPRFVHIQGMPPDRMFDNKTGQTCIISPIAHDSVETIDYDMRQFAIARGEEPHKLDFFVGYGYEGTQPVPPETSWTHLPRADYQKFYDRYNALMKNPNNPPVYHYEGISYCKEL
jgi:hypothetical protein